MQAYFRVAIDCDLIEYFCIFAVFLVVYVQYLIHFYFERQKSILKTVPPLWYILAQSYTMKYERIVVTLEKDENLELFLYTWRILKYVLAPIFYKNLILF